MNALDQWLIQHESSLRLAVFLFVFCSMALWETLQPARAAHTPKRVRWLNNIGLLVINSFALRLLFPLAAVGFVQFAQQHKLGLLNNYAIPLTIALPCSVVLLDLCIYWQHRAFHHVPLLWRLHRVHHMDTDMDVTTAARFHTFEIMLSMAIKWLIIIALGAPVIAVIAFEALLNASATFNHANIRLPAKWDKPLRLLVVTPNMHRVHHSNVQTQTDSNFGFFLSLWDKLFNTYHYASASQEQAIQIGLTSFRQHPWRLTTMLANPFRTAPKTK